MKSKAAPQKSSTSTRTPARRKGTPFFKKSSLLNGQKSTALQSRLRSGEKGDRFEMEADAIADRVVQQRRTGALSSEITPVGSNDLKRRDDRQQQADEELQAEENEKEQVQTKEQEKEPLQQQSDDEVQQQPQEEEEEQLQAKEDDQQPEEALQQQSDDELQQQPQEKEEEQVQAMGQGSLQASTAAAEPLGNTQVRINARKGLGSPLPTDVRAEMESYFAADFTGLRIHTDDSAAALNRALRSQAFAHGRDVFFGAGKFNPHTRTGKHLLAHELTHTIQQGAVNDRESMPASDAAGLQRKDEETIHVRPEVLQAIRLARGEIGKVNAKKTGEAGTRMGWERLHEYFNTAFNGKDQIPIAVIRQIVTVATDAGKKDAMPAWCGVFVWWAMKKAGIPMPGWKQARSIISADTRRPTGQLPQKGDIAYREKNSHFALVTGIEDAASRDGKNTQAIRVATINGNTSGEDNLGGQIEEKWEPLSRWHSFFDVLGKMDLPEANLVEVQVVPDEQSDTAELTQADTEVPQETAAEDTEEVLADSEVTPAPIEIPPESATDIAVELLPEPPPAAPEEVAKVEDLSLAGSSDVAMTQIIDAPASQMAKAQPALGASLQGKLRSERASAAEDAPVLVAKTSGEVDAGITPADQIPLPGDASITEGKHGVDSGELQVDAHAHLGGPPNNDQNRKLLDDQDRGGDLLAWLRANMASFLARISTTDPKLNTRAGPAPKVKLQGDANPQRVREQRTDAQDQVRGQRDKLSTTIRQNPGQINIQPKEVNEERKAGFPKEVEGNIETTADNGMAEYVNAPLPENVRNKSDELLAPALQTSLAPAREKTVSAADARDTDKKKEIDGAKAQAQQINESADKDQREIVISNRRKVAEQQRTGIRDAYEEVNAFSRDADKEQKSTQGAITDKVKSAESGAKKELKKGENDAEAEKRKGEENARQKKKELKKKQKKKSWWQRAKDAVKSAVAALTKAIDKVFNAARKLIKKAIDAAKNLAIGLINKARKWIVDKLNDFRNWAKNQVNKYLKDRFPALAKRINGAIDATVDTAIAGVNKAADLAIAGIEKLAAALSAALDKILAVFQTALKAAVQIAGAVMTGDFAEALRIAIRAACDIAGIDSAKVFGFIDRAKQSVMTILKDPVKFFGNLVRAVGNGLRNFWKNIKKHFVNGLLGWLTGALSDVPITMPESLNLRGILSLTMQVLGLTYENIKARIIKRYPPAEKIFNLIEKGFTLIKKVAVEGPVALWNEVKQRLTDFKDKVLGEIRNFAVVTVTKEAIGYVLGLLNPAGAIVKVVQLLYRFVTFLMERFEQIKDFVLSIYDTVAEMAAGNFAKVTAAVENALAKSLPVVISLLAKLAGLGGIGKTIQKILKTVRKPINKVIDAVVDKVIKFAKKLLKKGKAIGKKVLGKLAMWWKLRVGFKAQDGSSHTLLFKGSGASARLMVRSKEQPYTNFLDTVDLGQKPTAAKKTALAEAKKVARVIDDKKHEKLAGKDDEAKKRAAEAKKKEIKNLITKLSAHTEILFGAKVPQSKVTWTPASPRDFGETMHAYPLTRIPDPEYSGSAPSDTNKEFDALNLRRYPGGAAYYIRGHLLNEKLGGPGKWHNMTPLSVTGNKKHEREAEAFVKAGVNSGAIMEYEVEAMASNRGDREKVKQELEKEHSAKQMESLTKIVDMEDKVPASLSIKIRTLEPKTGGKDFTVKDNKDKTVENPIKRDASSYFLHGAPKIEPIDVNRLHEEQPGEDGPPIKRGTLEKLTLAVKTREQKDGTLSKKFRTYEKLESAAGVKLSDERKAGFLVLK